MNARILGRLVFVVISMFPALAVAEEPDRSGMLDVRAALVGTDLSVTPLPRSRFLLVPVAPEGEPREVVTGFDGTLETRLPAGLYRIRSVDAVEFRGQRLRWDLEYEIVAGETTGLELSNDNAIIESGGKTPSATPEGEVYNRLHSGVLTILSNSGRGSGFLFSSDGLILTNHHVVADADYLAARFVDGRKHALRLLASDPRRDVAVLQVHPDTVRGLPAIELADDRSDAPAVMVGQRVLAIGSPLSAESILTSGLVSKVEQDSIYSDVDINPGNSGGPLLDLDGRAVGITTFGLGGDSGPGLAGVVRIHSALPLIEQARAAVASGEPPSDRSLPVEPDYRFSPDDVKRLALAREFRVADYRVEAGKFDVNVITPVATAGFLLQREQAAAREHEKRTRKKSKKQGQDEATESESPEIGQAFYEWQKDTDNFRAVVIVRAIPEVKVKTGSAFLSALTGVGAKYRFKADFDRMELRRDGLAVEPILPGKIREVVSVGNAAASMQDIGYYGWYEYPPEAFLPGARVQLFVWQIGESEPIETEVPAELLARVRDDFQPYLDRAEP